MVKRLGNYTILLSALFLFTASAAPVNWSKHKDIGTHRISRNKFESANKKSHLKKKTSISINGKLLPLAQLQTSNKDVHLTVQKANPMGGQFQQPNIQEVSLAGAQNVGGINGGIQNTGGQMTTTQIGLHPGIQTPNNLGNGIQTTNTLGNTNNGNPVLGMSPGITNPGNPALGMSPGITNPGNQVLGMSPGVTNPGNQVLGMSPGITNPGNQNGIPNQGVLTNCGANNLVQGQNNLNTQGQISNTQRGNQMLLGSTGSDGNLVYKPVAC